MPAAKGQSICQGTDFWVTLANNLTGNGGMEIKVVADAPTTGTITSPLGLNISFSVNPGTPYVYVVPTTYAVSSYQTVQNLGLHVQTASSVRVFTSSVTSGSGDATMVYPTPALGTQFRVGTYYNLYQSTLQVVATANNTQVTFILPCNSYSGSPANTPITTTLNAGQTYCIAANCELTGALVTSTQPIQLMAGSYCAQVPSGVTYCDAIFEYVLPTTYWGTRYVTTPTGGRTGQDRFRVVAMNAGTNVFLNGTSVATLNAGQYYEALVSGGNVITASNDVAVFQYALGASAAGSAGDPGMVQLIPTDMYETAYKFATLNHANINSHWLTIVARTAGTGSILLNGTAVTGWLPVAGGSSGFSYVIRSMPTGEYTLTGDSLFHGIMAGWGSYNSYINTIGGTNPVVILPAEDWNLQGEYKQGKGNLLQGNLASELTGTWEMERSPDAMVTEKRMALSAQPDHSFNLMDESVTSPSTWFYRLRHQDTNGKISTGDWIAVNAQAGNLQLNAYPNPFVDHFQIDFALQSDGMVGIALFDVSGKLMYEKSLEGVLGANSYTLSDLDPALPKGAFLLKVTANGQTVHQTLIHK